MEQLNIILRPRTNCILGLDVLLFLFFCYGWALGPFFCFLSLSLSLSLSLCFSPASRHWMLPTLAISISNLRMEIYIINIIGLLKIMLVKFILWNRLSSTVIFFLDKCLIKFSFLCINSWKLVLLFINKAQVLLKLPFEKWEQWTRKMWESS